MKTVIVGGGKIGLSLARTLIDKGHTVSLIEMDKIRCNELANALDAQIIYGDGSKVSILELAGTKNADCFMAVTESDQDNIVSSQLAKNYFNAKKVIARSGDPRNLETYRLLGIDYAVNSTEIITKLIEQEADLDKMHLLANFGEGNGAICSMKLPENTAYHGVKLQDIKFPSDMLIVSVVRDSDKMIIPRGSTVLEKGDDIIAVCERRFQKTMTKLLAEVQN